MPFDPSLLVIPFAVFVGLWPIAFLGVLLRHSLAREWHRVGRIALLLPLWTVAASVGLRQLAPYIAEPSAAHALPSPFITAAGVGFAACCVAAGWWLLLRSFGGPSRPAANDKA